MKCLEVHSGNRFQGSNVPTPVDGSFRTPLRGGQSPWRRGRGASRWCGPTRWCGRARRSVPTLQGRCKLGVLTNIIHAPLQEIGVPHKFFLHHLWNPELRAAKGGARQSKLLLHETMHDHHSKDLVRVHPCTGILNNNIHHGSSLLHPPRREIRAKVGLYQN